MSADIKVPKSAAKNEDQEIDPFSAAERDLIIQAFALHRRYQHYASFVTFLFRTGCRPSEAVALQWKHISQDFSTISFEDAIITYTRISHKAIKNGAKNLRECNYNKASSGL